MSAPTDARLDRQPPSTWATARPPRTPPIADDATADRPEESGPLTESQRSAVDWETLCADSDQQPDQLSNPVAYLNREFSERSFQWRVLYEALDAENPPLERLKFLAILTTNMDEFFMKRIGGLKQQIAADVTERTIDGRTPEQQWVQALELARPIFEIQSQCYGKSRRKPRALARG